MSPASGLSSGTGVLAILLSVEPEDVGRLRETERGGQGALALVGVDPPRCRFGQRSRHGGLGTDAG